LSESLGPLLANTDAPDSPQAAAVVLGTQALEAVRDANEARICALIDWHGKAKLDAALSVAIERHLRAYMDRQLKWELKTSAKPMFAEMSDGSE